MRSMQMGNIDLGQNFVRRVCSLLITLSNVVSIIACSSSPESNAQPSGGAANVTATGGSGAMGGTTDMSSAGGSGATGGTTAATTTSHPTQAAGSLVDFLGNPEYPDDFWQIATLAESHVNGSLLQQALDKIRTSQWEIHGFVLVRNGRLIFEQYGWKTGKNADDPDKSQHQVKPTERHLLHSTTKSVTSTLIGIALDEGLLPGVDDLVVPHFPEYQPLPEPSADKDALTLEDVLTMRSGLQWNEGTPDYDAVLPASDPAKVMLSRPLVDTPVGTVWNYSTGACEILTALLGKVTGKTPLAYALDKLFSPLGITDVTWEASANGINHGGYGLLLAPREMARFGELMRNRGQWKGLQIVSSSYVDTATAVHCDTYWGGSYGYLFWIPELPGFFGTRGAYGQNIYVSRDLGVVAAFTSDLPGDVADSRLDGLMRDYVIPAME